MDPNSADILNDMLGGELNPRSKPHFKDFISEITFVILRAASNMDSRSVEVNARRRVMITE